MKSVLIIGLGRFGHHLCMDMANRGNEVMIIDKDEKKTTDLLEYATAVRVDKNQRKHVHLFRH